jgi:hypothetical protein
MNKEAFTDFENINEDYEKLKDNPNFPFYIIGNDIDGYEIMYKEHNEDLVLDDGIGNPLRFKPIEYAKEIAINLYKDFDKTKAEIYNEYLSSIGINKESSLLSKDTLSKVLEWARKGLKFLSILKYRWPIETILAVKFMNKLIDNISEEFGLKKKASYDPFMVELGYIQREINKIGAEAEAEVYRNEKLQERMKYYASFSKTKMPLKKMASADFYQSPLLKTAFIHKNEGTLWVLDDSGYINRLFDKDEEVAVEG